MYVHSWLHNRGRILGGKMKYNRVCQYCGKIFVTNQNAKKFCRKKCSIYASKKQKNKEKACLCQWCGQIFLSSRKRSFCNSVCHREYMSKTVTYKRSVVKVPIKITLTDAVNGAKKENLTYGRYVSLKKI